MKRTAPILSRPKASHRPFPYSSKALGQHYLVDRAIAHHIIEAGDLRPTDIVVEVGPGRGALTGELVGLTQQVVAVERDPGLAASLPGRLGHPPNLRVVCADARTCDFAGAVSSDQPWKVVANLPYYAANPIVRRLLEGEPRPSLMVVMVQREVAHTMVAGPGRMGLLSVAVQFYGRPRLVCPVPPQAFRPPPKVTSAVVRIDLLPSPFLPAEDAADFFELVRAGFSAPRKQLHNALSHGLAVAPAEATRLLEAAGVESTRRAGSLSLEEWGRLYHARTREA